MEFGFIFTLLLAFMAIVIIFKGILIVRQSECVVIERLGSFYRILNSGLNVIIPFIDQPRTIYWVYQGRVYPASRLDLRETVLDVPEQAVITKDNVSIDIDALLYVQLVDPIKATYEHTNLPVGVGQLAQTSLRNVIGEMDLDQTLSSRDTINKKLKAILDEATNKWGTKVNRVEIKNITPPRDIQIAMEKQMQAERERRAKVLDAQGDKEARIRRSEGLKTEQINIAEAQKVAQISIAEGEASAIKQVAEAKKEAIAHIKSELGSAELTTQFLIATNYLEEFGKFAQKPGDKVYIPYEASTALGTIGSIKDILKDAVPSNGTSPRFGPPKLRGDSKRT